MTDQTEEGRVEQQSTLSGASSRGPSEDNLRESIHRFQTLVENASCLVFIATVAGDPSDSSPSATKLLGYPPRFFRGQRLLDITHSDDISGVAGTLADACHQSATPVPEIQGRIQCLP